MQSSKVKRSKYDSREGGKPMTHTHMWKKQGRAIRSGKGPQTTWTRNWRCKCGATKKKVSVGEFNGKRSAKVEIEV
jgi:hypothetical protein